MGYDSAGYSKCIHCGAEYRLFTIFNRDMQGLTKAWKIRHERSCILKSPKQRLAWAKKYIGLDRYESAIIVDVLHVGFEHK